MQFLLSGEEHLKCRKTSRRPGLGPEPCWENLQVTTIGVTSCGALGTCPPVACVCNVPVQFVHAISIFQRAVVVNTTHFPHAVVCVVTSLFQFIYLCRNFCDFCLISWNVGRPAWGPHREARRARPGLLDQNPGDATAYNAAADPIAGG